MKRYYTLAIVAATSIAAMAQDYTYAERLGRTDPMGSARSQAMGGAFGALGADLTSSVINPAGIGAYRASEMGMTLAVTTRENTTLTPRAERSYINKDTHLLLDQIGGVFSSSRTSQESGTVGHSFSMAYNKLADYDAMYTLRHERSKNSLLDYFAGDSRADNQFEGGLAKTAEMILDFYEDQVMRRDENGEPVLDANGDPIYDTNHIDVVHNIWEYPFENEDQSEILFDETMRRGVMGYGNINVYRHFNDKGHKGEFSFNYAQNISNQFFWGIKMGILSYTFDRDMTHSEFFDGDPQYGASNKFRYHSSLKQEGTGFVLGAGFLYVPMPELRIGLAVHSPQFFAMTDITESSIHEEGRDEFFSPVNEWKYKYTAPARMIASVAGVLGNLGIISADYELVGYGSSKFRNSDEPDSEQQYYDDLNADLGQAIKNVHKFRVGAEVKPLSNVSLRAGYKMQTSPYQSGILDRTYLNRSISGGIGVRFSNIFMDLAFVNTKVHDETWILPDSGSYLYEEVKPSDIDQKSNKIIFSIGYRF